LAAGGRVLAADAAAAAAAVAVVSLQRSVDARWATSNGADVNSKGQPTYSERLTGTNIS